MGLKCHNYFAELLEYFRYPSNGIVERRMFDGIFWFDSSAVSGINSDTSTHLNTRVGADCWRATAGLK